MTKEVTLKVNLDTEDLMRRFLNHEMENPLVLKLKRVSEHVKAPEYKTTHSACFDLYTSLQGVESVVAYGPDNDKVELDVLTIEDGGDIGVLEIPPKYRVLIPTGYIFGIPKDYSLRIHPRSSSALKIGVNLANGQAIIDHDYTEQSYIMAYNISDTPVWVNHNDRLAQGELTPVYRCQFEEVDELDEIETNRKGGLGHTGK